jgi:hypothetical protein
MGNAGADIVVDADYCPAVIFLTLRKIFGRRVGTPNTVAGSAAYRTADRNSSSSISR